ncbi:hypothetical protein FA95DRAFT_1489827 [Auriscalpium vulgare]|uniref:Uncharacterized protein n=1 Tax=Auriscalpium vulgare TaxID=40419 RepID=A0ACB8RZP2_9AGAM|nr:hypothetical protein FA95DRAFT_1489827 [Auriscalpium vulgare]
MGDGPRAGPSSGLKLVLPSLSALKARTQRNSPVVEDLAVKKILRPVKLKPLKEVLSVLITKIKKKDDYAFFLTPVDLENVPGYTDTVKRPMDFGTMSTKVDKGKYRSLEEFAADFHLVLANAKAFNPPGSIYYTEAERIESWASEHISKASAQVIQYEADWTIDVEKDEDTVNIDGDDDAGAGAGTSAGPETPLRRSQSVGSSSVPPQNRRPRGPKKAEGMSETLEPDWHLPGFKDGLGVFPPGSDWAHLMLALKLKGKRYRTKKERLRMERGGPPFAADGSLDYSEMEDPYTILSILAPEPLSRPKVMPLYPPPPPDPLQTALPAPANIPPPPSPPPLPASLTAPSKPGTGKPKYKHWTINRVVSSRSRAKDKEEEEQPPAWKTPRDLHATDFGPFATLAGRLAREGLGRVGELGTQEMLFEAVRRSVESKAFLAGARKEDAAEGKAEAERAREAQEWIREVVYGGADGLAYVRSVAEFVSPPPGKVRLLASEPSNLGMSLPQYVDQTVIEPLLEGRHRLVTSAAQHASTSSAPYTAPRAASPPTHPEPEIFRTLDSQLDLAALIKAPDELFAAEGAWAQAGVSADDPLVLSRSLDRAAELLEKLSETKNVGVVTDGADKEKDGAEGEKEQDVQEEEQVEGEVKMEVDVEVVPEEKVDEVKMEVDEESEKPPLVKENIENGVDLEALQRELRLNLIALVKRAPLDRIARMPPELVPVHLRGVVPTIGF